MIDYAITKQQPEPIKVITIDDKQYEVKDMNEELQKIIAVFNRWNEKEADVQHELNLLADEITMIRAAKDTVSRQILDKFRAGEEEKAGDATKEAVEASNDEA